MFLFYKKKRKRKLGEETKSHEMVAEGKGNDFTDQTPNRFEGYIILNRVNPNHQTHHKFRDRGVLSM